MKFGYSTIISAKIPILLESNEHSTTIYNKHPHAHIHELVYATIIVCKFSMQNPLFKKNRINF